MKDSNLPSPFQKDTSADSSKSSQSSSLQTSTLWTRLLGLTTFTTRRLLFGIIVLLFIIFLSYLGLDMASGVDFLPAFEGAIPKTVEYISRGISGDLGKTTAGSNTLVPRPVTEVLATRLPRSLGLLGISLVFASIIGIFLGVLAAQKQSERSLVIIISTIIGISIPSFFAAFLLQWAATIYTQKVGVRLLPVGGFGWDSHIILPMLVLAARPIAQITRITFVSIRQVLNQDYIRTAHSKGLHRYRIMAMHVFQNAAIPILTTIGLSLRFSLSSLPVVEYFFGWPGAGFSILKGIAQQDYNLTVGLSLSLGGFFILTNLLLELSYRIIDRRLIDTPEFVRSHEKQNIFETIRSSMGGLIDILKDNSLTHWIKSIRKKRQIKKDTLALDDTQPIITIKPEQEIPQRYMPNLMAILKNIPLIFGGILVAGIIVVVFFGPRLAPNDPFHIQGLVKIDGELTPPPLSPNNTYPFGTDALGRGILSLLLSGAQQTLMLGAMVVALRTLVGTILGTIAGWYNESVVDRTIMGMAEIISAFPTLLIVMILILAFGIRQGLRSFIIALCFVGWGEIMLYVRSEVISIRPKLFIESAVAVGAQTPHIIMRHILPNLFSALISIVSLEMSAVLMLLGELGFIGIFIGGGSLIALSAQTIHYSDIPEWGALLSNIRYQARPYPWTALYPMLAFFLAILSFNLFGEGIRRIVDKGQLIISRVINRYTVSFAVLCFLGINWLQVNSGSTAFYKQHADEFDTNRAMSHISILSHPGMQGRSLGTPGTDLAAIYIASEFEKMELQQISISRGYFQERKRSFEILNSSPVFRIDDQGPDPVFRDDFAPYPGKNASADYANGPIRYMALGKQASPVIPGVNFRMAYPELDRANFSDQILLALSRREANLLTGVKKDGLLVVTDDQKQLERNYTLSGRSGKWLDLTTGDLYGEEDPYLWISEKMADRLLAPSGKTVDQLRGERSQLALEEVYQMQLETEASIQISGEIVTNWPVKHIIGLIPGTWGYDLCTDCLDKKLIVVLAQYDSPPPAPDNPAYPAANNNASGVAVVLEAIRVIQESDYQPYKSFLIVAYSGEGLDGGEPVPESDVHTYLQSGPGLNEFELEAIVNVRGVGGGSGDMLEVSAGGSLRLAKLIERAAKQMGVGIVRADEDINLGLIYDEGNSSFYESGQEAPIVRLFWEGWEEHSLLPTDTMENISQEKIEKAGRTLALSLMILGRETEY